MELVKRQLADLKPAEYNPRKALKPGDPEYQRIAASIEEFGYVDPIIINADNTIIGGHQRRTVMLDLGYTEADCILVEMDKTREKALNIALNKITGEWDEAVLKDLLIDLDKADYNVNLTGFDGDEIDKLFAEVELTQEANDDGYNPEKKLADLTEIRTRPGDIWQLGSHRLMCGDATDLSDVERLMEGAAADLIITDPPYNVDYEIKDKSLERSCKRNRTRTDNEIRNDRMSNDAFYSFLYKAFCNFNEIARPGCSAYIFHAEMEGINFRTAFHWAQILIWEKNQFVIGRQDYQWRHEPILYGWKEGDGHYFGGGRRQDTVFIEDDIDFSAMKKAELVVYIEGIRERLQENTSVLYEKKPARSDMHPTMKPVALIGRLITNSSKYGDNVADFFGGSGTTLIACEQLNRSAYLMELNELRRYYRPLGRIHRPESRKSEGGRRVQQLTQEGVVKTTEIPGEGRRYELVPTIKTYIQYLSDKAYGKGKFEKETELRQQKLEAEIALKESQGEMHRMRAEIAAGKYVDVEEVALDYQKFFVTFKRFALSIPSRLVSMISDSLEPLEARRVEKEMNAEVKRMLRAFVVSGYTPEPGEEKPGKRRAKT